MSTLGLAGIDLGADIISQGTNYLFNSMMHRKQRKHDQAMSELAHRQNVAAWEMQNEYNTPANQMQRFKDAGLNPHLIYGKGTPGNADKIAPYQRSTQSEYPKVNMQFDLVDKYLDISQKKANIDYVREQTKLAGERSIIANITGKYMPELKEHQLAEWDWKFDQKFPAEIAQKLQSANLSIAQQNMLKRELFMLENFGVRQFNNAIDRRIWTGLNAIHQAGKSYVDKASEKWGAPKGRSPLYEPGQIKWK